ncbi:adenylyltransferase/cytidyltransferase family protein [Candidatus Amesbacteria bacterium]|nr:adenylyltransferase/cytidyltransferase family protein [Candidatus Amesbacteria bacterium]MBI2587466.1 adenylyltransferase/cytidyltransferase family protein [Candidatus Amesbacteria bacterium]
MAKIISFHTACQLSQKLRAEGKKVIFTSGCFDILHIGHVKFLQKAKKWGGSNSVLLVGIEPDNYVKERKGVERPFFTQINRLQIVSSLASVDFAIKLDYSSTEREFIFRHKKLKPSVVVAGSSEDEIIRLIKKESRKAGLKFVHFNKPGKLDSSTRVISSLPS